MEFIVKKSEVVLKIVGDRLLKASHAGTVSAFASANIALCKYWGKRDAMLNLPMTSSLSISLGEKGTKTQLSYSDSATDVIFLNGALQDLSSAFAKRVIEFLDLFRVNHQHFRVESISTIPIAAGLASSASGFASLILALNELGGWQLSRLQLSILARLGSGSACRSLWPGFVEWVSGQDLDGMDSYGQVLPYQWKDLAVGLCLISQNEKKISSREAMQRTLATSPLYGSWPQKVSADLVSIKKAIENQDFELLGKTAESNAMTMHGMMLSAWPPVNYCLPETISTMHRIWQCRAEGIPVYFTQDAGPNLKLLFLKKNRDDVIAHFPDLQIVFPFKEG